jgi:GH35 family endo-1,4-beta-xylanase
MDFYKKIAIFALAGLVSAANAGPGLADGAAKFVGNITTKGAVRTDFGTYWNQITAENECKWASIEGTRHQYNFSGCKAAYDWAKNNGGHFKFHALIWGSQYPSWLEGMSVADTKTAITEWFDKVKENFPDLEMIDVVNEAIRTGNNVYHSCYGSGLDACPNQKVNIKEALGGDNNGNYQFVTTAFEMARERWPNAILIYNDYNTVQYNLDQGIDLINTIKKNGAPVDAYGLQAHDMMTQGGGQNGTGGGGNCIAFSTLKSAIEKIWNQTQMPMFISEYDINTSDDNIQKKCYEEQITYFMENEHIAGITIWGYINGATWLTNSGIMQPTSTPTYQNPNVSANDRPAMTWLKQYLASHTGVNTTGLNTGVVTPPEPQKPFKGTAFDILSGKLQAEDFDIPGTGSGNNSYYDSDSENNGGSTYRNGTGVDIKDVKDASGNIVNHVIGWNATGDWLEYTINVAQAGDYTLFAAVSGDNAQMRFSLDGENIGSVINVSKSNAEPTEGEEVGEEVYSDFYKVKTNVTLSAGEHVLRMTVVQQWFDLDYFNFVKGANAADTDPLSSNSSSVSSSSASLESSNSTNPESSSDIQSSDSSNPESSSDIQSSDSNNLESSSGIQGSDSSNSNGGINNPQSIANFHITMNRRSGYDVVDIHGVIMCHISANTTSEAITTAKNSDRIKSSGIYYLRSKATGKMQSVRIIK